MQEEQEGAVLRRRDSGAPVHRGEARRRGRQRDARRHQRVDPHAAGTPRPAPRGGVRVPPARGGGQPAGAVGQGGGRLHQAPHRGEGHDHHRKDTGMNGLHCSASISTVNLWLIVLRNCKKETDEV